MLTQKNLNKLALGLLVSATMLSLGSNSNAVSVDEPSDVELYNTLGKIDAAQEDQQKLNDLLSTLSDLSEQVAIRQIELDYCDNADTDKIAYAQEVLSITSQIEAQADKTKSSEVADAIDIIESDLSRTDICE